MLERRARACGAAIGEAVSRHAGQLPSPATTLAPAVVRALAAEGYEPRADSGGLLLVNCPFSSVVADQPELICRMNLALLEGFAAALPGGGLAARLRPTEGACCVRLDLDDR